MTGPAGTAATDVPAARVDRFPVILASLLLAVGGAIVLALPPASFIRAIASQTHWAALSLLACVSAFRRARREPTARTGWRLLGSALALMTAATLSTIVQDVRAGEVTPFPRLGDWLQLPAFAAMGFALLAWPVASASLSQRLRTFVDGLLFAVAVFSTLWATVLSPIHSAGVAGEVWAVIVAQFGILTVIFAIVAYLGLADTSRLRGPLGWMAIALAAAMLGALAILAAGAVARYYVGHPTDIAASTSFLLFVRATASPRPVTGASREDAPLLDPLLFGGWLTYGSVFVAFAVGIWALVIERRTDMVLLLHGFGIVGLLILRQLLAVRDIRVLTNGLEAKVAERTHALEESQAVLMRTARLEALGRLAGGVAHDMNNLLTGILGYAELIETASPVGDTRREDALEIRKSVERGSRLTRQLLAFARKQPSRAVVLDPVDLVRDLEGLLRRLIGPDIALAVTGAEGTGRVRIDPGQFEQVIVNMAINARDAMPQGGRLEVSAGNADLDAAAAARVVGGRAGRFVRVAVRDTGAGMSPDVLARIFEPFFTTKGEGKGTGLGLATCYGIVNQASGFVTVDSAPGAGTVFEVYLPLCSEATQWRPSEDGIAGPTHGTETILLAEDERAVREVMTATLQSQGYAVLDTASGEEACALAARHAGPIHLLLTDMMMPGMNGLEAAERIGRERPGLRVLVVSGFMPEAPSAAADGHRIGYVAKPVSPLDLARRVRAMLDESPATAAVVTQPPARPAAP